MKKPISFLIVVSFLLLMANVAKGGNIVGTWTIDQAYDLYDNSGNLFETGYAPFPKATYWEQEGEIRCPVWWYEHDPATSRYTATHSNTLNNDMVSYSYAEDFGIWMELDYTDLYLVVIGDMMIGEVNGVYTGNVGLAGWRHDPSEPLQWDDLT